MRIAIIALPDRETMLANLLRVDNSQEAREKFYPLLLEHANEECCPERVVAIFIQAILTFARDLSPTAAEAKHDQAEMFLNALVCYKPLDFPETVRIYREIRKVHREINSIEPLDLPPLPG